MTGTLVRDYRSDDAGVLTDMLREMQAYEVPFNRHLKRPEDIGEWYVQRILKNFTGTEGYILVAEIDGRLAGFAVLYVNLSETGEEEELPHSYALVSELMVAADHRGKGLGKRLLAECERRARKAGRDEMRLAVYPDNAPALGLYRSQGYAPVKIRMAKRLG